MAVAIMGGLSVATFLTLINLPSLYVLLFGVRQPSASPSGAAAPPELNGRIAHALVTEMTS
jgi:hypothetical protein